MIEQSEIQSVYDRICRAKSPITVILFGTHKIKIKGLWTKNFDSKLEVEDVPTDSIVGTYTNIEYQDFYDDIAVAFDKFKPQMRVTDPRAIGEVIDNKIRAQEAEFTPTDIAAGMVTKPARSTINTHIIKFVEQGEVVFIGYLPGSNGEYLYAKAGTDAATQYYPSNIEIIRGYLQEHGWSTPQSIADNTTVDYSSVHTVLKTMRNRSEVNRKKVGKESLYELAVTEQEMAA